MRMRESKILYNSVQQKLVQKKTSTQKTALTVKNAFFKKKKVSSERVKLLLIILLEKNNGFLQIVR